MFSNESLMKASHLPHCLLVTYFCRPVGKAVEVGAQGGVGLITPIFGRRAEPPFFSWCFYSINPDRIVSAETIRKQPLCPSLLTMKGIISPSTAFWFTIPFTQERVPLYTS